MCVLCVPCYCSQASIAAGMSVSGVDTQADYDYSGQSVMWGLIPWSEIHFTEFWCHLSPPFGCFCGAEWVSGAL